MSDKATPVPWTYRQNPDFPDHDWRHSHWIDGGPGNPVGELRDLADGAGEANARLIVQAVNSYGAMLAALRLINEIAERESMGGKDAPDAYGTIGRKAREALRFAEIECP